MKKNGFGTGLMYVVLVFLMVGLGFLLFFNYRANREQRQAIQAAEEAAAVTPTPEPTTTPVPTTEPDRSVQTVRLAFAGDLVGQAGLTSDAEKTGSEGETIYDFTDELAGASGLIGDADLTACTLVSTVTGSGAYDAYSMPRSVADGLRSVGFDLVNAATDHLLDRGVPGLIETVETLQNAGLAVMGAYNSAAARQLPIATVNGIKVAYLSYTYGTAGTGSQPVSVADYSWCVDILTTDYMTGKETVDYDKIDADIAAVKEAGADIVVCFVYWWDNTQYYTEPRDQQRRVADYLCENGVDIVIGGGVKVAQPIEVRTVERDDGKANCVVCYSLSNLMSCFNDSYTNMSAVANIQLSRDVDSGDVWISGLYFSPLFMLDTEDYSDYGEPGYRYRVLDARAAMTAYEQGQGGPVSAEAYAAIQTGVNDLEALMGQQYAAVNGGAALEFPY